MRRCRWRVVVRFGADRVQRGRQTAARIVDPGCEPFRAAILKGLTRGGRSLIDIKIVSNDILVCCRVNAPTSWVPAKPGAICPWRLSNIFSLGWLCGGSEKEKPLLAGKFRGKRRSNRLMSRLVLQLSFHPCFTSVFSPMTDLGGGLVEAAPQ
jgi:hypothetical protein